MFGRMVEGFHQSNRRCFTKVQLAWERGCGGRAVLAVMMDVERRIVGREEEICVVRNEKSASSVSEAQLNFGAGSVG